MSHAVQPPKMTPPPAMLAQARPLPPPRKWWQRLVLRTAWGFLKGGYFMVSPAGVWFMQRFHEWGVAAVGQQREFIVRFELALRPVTTNSLMHLDLMDFTEARLWILDFKVWPGVACFFIVNLGARLTKASREFRAQEAAKVLKERARREMAERVQIRRHMQRGHPWPSGRR